MRLLPVCDEEEVQLADTRALRSFATEVHLPILRQAGQAVTCSGSDSISSPVHLPVLPQAGQAVTCSGTDSISSPASSATSRSGSHVFWYRYRFDPFTCQFCDKQVRQSHVLVSIRSSRCSVFLGSGIRCFFGPWNRIRDPR